MKHLYPRVLVLFSRIHKKIYEASYPQFLKFLLQTIRFSLWLGLCWAIYLCNICQTLRNSINMLSLQEWSFCVKEEYWNMSINTVKLNHSHWIKVSWNMENFGNNNTIHFSIERQLGEKMSKNCFQFVPIKEILVKLKSNRTPFQYQFYCSTGEHCLTKFNFLWDHW